MVGKASGMMNSKLVVPAVRKVETKAKNMIQQQANNMRKKKGPTKKGGKEGAEGVQKVEAVVPDRKQKEEKDKLDVKPKEEKGKLDGKQTEVKNT